MAIYNDGLINVRGEVLIHVEDGVGIAGPHAIEAGPHAIEAGPHASEAAPSEAAPSEAAPNPLPHELLFSNSLGKNGALNNVGTAAWFVDNKQLLLYSGNNTLCNYFCRKNTTYQSGIFTDWVNADYMYDSNDDREDYNLRPRFEIAVKDTNFTRIRFQIKVHFNFDFYQGAPGPEPEDPIQKYSEVVDKISMNSFIDDPEFEIKDYDDNSTTLMYDNDAIDDSILKINLPEIKFEFAKETSDWWVRRRMTYTITHIEFDVSEIPNKTYTYSDWIDVAYPRTYLQEDMNNNMHYLFEEKQLASQKRYRSPTISESVLYSSLERGNDQDSLFYYVVGIS